MHTLIVHRLILWQKITDEAQATIRTIATSIGIAGPCCSFSASSWMADPQAFCLWTIIDFCIFTFVAFRFTFPSAHICAALTLTLAYVFGTTSSRKYRLDCRGFFRWHEDPFSLASEPFSSHLRLLAVQGASVRKRSMEAGSLLSHGCGVALVGIVIVSFMGWTFGDPYSYGIAWIYALYAVHHFRFSSDAKKDPDLGRTDPSPRAFPQFFIYDLSSMFLYEPLQLAILSFATVTALGLAFLAPLR